MASLLRKLLKKPPLPPPPLRALLTSVTPSHLSDPWPSPLPLHQIHRPSLIPNPSVFHHSLQIYPSFPHCFHFGPISVSGVDPADAGISCEVESRDDRAAVWADSVKKKRKRKMNKHKYRKLRKRLRRRT